MTHQAPIVSGTPLDSSAPSSHQAPSLDQAASPDEDRPRPGDRWTAPKMAAFLRQLSATHSVSAAARSVGMSRQAAYRLRSRLKGSAFDLAWDVAFHHSYDNLAHAALERALDGVEIPVFYKGEQVGSYRKFDERLTLALLSRSTQCGNVPLLGRLGPEAERHAGRFAALVAEVEAGAAGDGCEDGVPEDPGPAWRSEIAALHDPVSRMSDAQIMAELRAYYEDEEE